MFKSSLLKKSFVIGLVIIFICSSFISSISGISEEITQMQVESIVGKSQDNVLVRCSTFGLPGKPSYEDSIPLSEAELLYAKIQKLQIELARDPLSTQTKQLYRDIITIARNNHLIPNDLSTDEIMSRLVPIKSKHTSNQPFPAPSGTASETFCNFASTGSGSALPIIIFPRLIPILLTPIPRLFVRWSTYEGVTSCGGLRSGKGFIATGAQRGTALGFWGIGFSIFLPPVKVYGLLGYALYASVNAENITDWPPNYPPDITILSPPNGAENVPIDTSELTFQLQDFNGALMNYSVTTNPNIGSGSGSSVPDGTYSISISGLEGTEEYTWFVQVDDGVNHVDVASSFTTEAVAPVVSNPKPRENYRYVSIDLNQLSFHLSDPQGDLMDYTVETSPNIGSGSGTNVDEGTYVLAVSGLSLNKEYTWYVNVTDGANWKHKVFHFQIEPIMEFDPFEEGWHYRKKIIINNLKVVGNLSSFPVLVSVIDTDLRNKAQDDGDDILFMDGDGVARRVYHEIENFDESNGELIAWVNISNLDPYQDTSFYMYYNNESSDNQQTSERVWDSNYQAVWHMSEYGTGLRHDSTSHYRHGTPYNYDGDEGIHNGIIDGCDNFDGINDYINTRVTFDYEYRTVSFWFNADSFPSDYIDCIIFQQSHELVYGSFHAGVKPDAIRLNAAQDNTFPPSPATPNNWYHCHMIRNGSICEYYINGYLYYTSQANSGGPTSNPNKFTVIATHRVMGSWCFDGSIDEIRILDKALTKGGIITEYNNQNDPSSFLSFGPEESGP
jgi:hypothetical protein